MAILMVLGGAGLVILAHFLISVLKAARDDVAEDGDDPLA